MNKDSLQSSIESHIDFPKKRIVFRDVLPILRDPKIFNTLIEDMSSLNICKVADSILAVDARGFIFGSAVAFKLSKPLVVARKPGKLPNETFQKSFDLEYGSTSIEIQKNTQISEDERVVIVDDLVATGGTAIACAELLTENFNVKESNILILGIIDLPDLGGSKLMKDRGYNIETLISY